MPGLSRIILSGKTVTARSLVWCTSILRRRSAPRRHPPVSLQTNGRVLRTTRAHAVQCYTISIVLWQMTGTLYRGCMETISLLPYSCPSKQRVAAVVPMQSDIPLLLHPVLWVIKLGVEFLTYSEAAFATSLLRLGSSLHNIDIAANQSPLHILWSPKRLLQRCAHLCQLLPDLGPLLLAGGQRLHPN